MEILIFSPLEILLGHSSLKYVNEKDLPRDYKTSIIINELNIDFTKPVNLVEGFFDMFVYPENTIPICGSSLAKETYLFQTLVKKKCEVVLMLDPDVKKKTYKIAENLMSYDVNVKYADVSPFKDVGVMNPEEVRDKIASAVNVDQTFLLRSRIWALSA